MAVYTYEVIEQEAEPTSATYPGLANGYIWIKTSLGTAYIYLNGVWIPFAGA